MVLAVQRDWQRQMEPQPSLRLQPDDQIVVLTDGYGAVCITVRYVADPAGVRMVEAEVPVPHPQADKIVANVAGALTTRTRLMIVDHSTSGSALVLPLQRIACPGRRHLAANFGRSL